MRGSRSTTGASAYGSTPRTSRTSSQTQPSRASPLNVIDVDEISDAAGGDGDGAEARATSTSARRCRSVASTPTGRSRPLDPFLAPNYSQSAYAGSSKEKGGPSSKRGKGGVSSREELARVAPSWRIVMSGSTTGLEMLEQALANWPVLELTRGGGPSSCIHPKFCKLYGPPPQGDAEYHGRQCSGVEEPDTCSNFSEEWVHSHAEWFHPDEDLACYTGYDD